jgi:asparagine synthase (glutamine-hydrolysing)
MCGFVGAVGGGRAVDARNVSRAAARLTTRGPDDAGVWAEGDVVLAHRRLAILDLSAAGHQPMASADGRYVIAYNGEIYNYRELRAQLEPPPGGWRGDSDTEVLLAAYLRWGVDCLARLRGMFAFALWDRQDRCLLLVRDRLGVKPLYYARHGGRWLFGSRPGALFALCPELPDAVDEQGLRAYLEAGYFAVPRTLYQAVHKLPPGHALLLGAGESRLWAWWNPLAIAPDVAVARRTEAEWLEELEARLMESVRLRLISDVPLGAFLSGGIDSSLVVALMARLSGRQVSTFTIGFDEAAYDESAHAAAVARHLGTAHHHERLSVDSLLDLLPLFERQFDEPFFDSSAFPALAVARLARRHVTVALGGDGGDEVFGGYHYYQALHRLAPLWRMPGALRLVASGGLAALPGHRVRLLAAALRQPDAVQCHRFLRGIAKDFDSPLLSETLARTAGLAPDFAAAHAAMPPALPAAEAAMRLDLTRILPEDYLQKTDVSSMAFSLEVREPLLDHELVEWGLSLPLSAKLRGGTGKYLLRQLAYRHVPRALLDRPKQGFAVPIDRWLRGPLRAWAQERLHDPALYQRFPLDKRRVLGLLGLHLSGQRQVHPLLWALLMLSSFACGPAERAA